MRSSHKLGISAAVILGTLTLSGCVYQPPHFDPIPDMHGVDPVKYNEDLAECYKRPWGIYVGNPVARCMKKKGYKFLVDFDL